MDPPLPPDCLAWLHLWEATLRDRDNDQLAAVAAQYLAAILHDRGVTRTGRPRYVI